LKNKKNIKYLSWFLVFVWMAVIFWFSAQPATSSKNLSMGVTEVILKILSSFFNIAMDTGTGNVFIGFLHHILRKIAHCTIYMVLALLVMNAFRRSEVNGMRLYLFSFLFCALYACTDEIHQLFVPGRGAQISDVLIDCIGAFIGIILYVLLKWGAVLFKKMRYKNF